MIRREKNECRGIFFSALLLLFVLFVCFICKYNTNHSPAVVMLYTKDTYYYYYYYYDSGNAFKFSPE